MISRRQFLRFVATLGVAGAADRRLCIRRAAAGLKITRYDLLRNVGRTASSSGSQRSRTCTPANRVMGDRSHSVDRRSNQCARRRRDRIARRLHLPAQRSGANRCPRRTGRVRSRSCARRSASTPFSAITNSGTIARFCRPAAMSCRLPSARSRTSAFRFTRMRSCGCARTANRSGSRGSAINWLT